MIGQPCPQSDESNTRVDRSLLHFWLEPGACQSIKPNQVPFPYSKPSFWLQSQSMCWKSNQFCMWQPAYHTVQPRNTALSSTPSVSLAQLIWNSGPNMSYSLSDPFKMISTIVEMFQFPAALSTPPPTEVYLSSPAFTVKLSAD